MKENINVQQPILLRLVGVSIFLVLMGGFFYFFLDTKVSSVVPGLHGEILLTLSSDHSKARGQNLYQTVHGFGLQKQKLTKFLPKENAHVVGAVHSNNGGRVVYGTKNRGDIWYQLYIASASAEDLWESEEKLTKSEGGKHRPKWSPDDQKIAYMVHTEGTSEENPDNWKIYVVDVETGEESYITNGAYPLWGPDGERLLFLKKEGVYAIDVSIEGNASLTQVVPMEGDGGARIEMHIELNNTKNQLIFSNPFFGHMLLYDLSWDTLEFEGYRRINLIAYWPTFSPDDRFIAFRGFKNEDDFSTQELSLYDIKLDEVHTLVSLDKYSSAIWISDWRATEREEKSFFEKLSSFSFFKVEVAYAGGGGGGGGDGGQNCGCNGFSASDSEGDMAIGCVCGLSAPGEGTPDSEVDRGGGNGGGGNGGGCPCGTVPSGKANQCKKCSPSPPGGGSSSPFVLDLFVEGEKAPANNPYGASEPANYGVHWVMNDTSQFDSQRPFCTRSGDWSSGRRQENKSGRVDYSSVAEGSYEYFMSCTFQGQTSSDSAYVEIGEGASRPAVNLDIREIGTNLWTNSVSVDLDKDVELRWSSNNATRCVGDTNFSTGNAPDGVQQEVLEPESGLRTYTVTCYNGSDGNDPHGTDSVSVNVLASAPQIMATPELVDAGETSTISWELNGHSECAISATNGDSIGSDPLTTDSSADTSAMFGQVTYTLTCDDTGASDEVRVRVRIDLDEI